MTISNRRDFLKSATAAGLIATVNPFERALFAMGRRPKGPRSIVCIYLRGGADWLNMIVPRDDDEYLAVRPTLAMNDEDGLVQLNRDWGLHPAFQSLEPFWKEKQLAPIVAVGSPHTTRSHFDAQDFMEFAAPGNRTVRSGWLNRYLQESQVKDASEFRGMAMQELLPRSLRGEFPVLAVPSGMDRNKGAKTLNRFEEFYGDGPVAGKMPGQMSGEMERPEDGAGIVESGRVTIETLRRYQEILAKGKTDVKYPDGRFSQRLAAMAKVLKAGEGLEVAGLDYGGWDDHANQGGAEGRHATRLKDLSDSLAAFCFDLGSKLDTTTIIVMTEFGRTVRENGNRGTDHGHGGGMFVLGGGVKGGKVYGDWQGLKAAQLYQGRDLQVTTDFRDVFHTVLDGTFDFKAPKGFFPDYKPKKISGMY
ncbi:MAG: DUF1501 domain-containing protein [Planctomycetes bacterium]|nr:DUF1501 domain-containing protein [Planctomycetota bacterium]